MRPHRDEKNLIGKECIRLVFEEDTHYHTVHGVARLVKEGASVSGDNFSFQELVDGEFVMSLSDGMGSGSRACKESEMFGGGIFQGDRDPHDEFRNGHPWRG